jgi:DNA-binding XRE family transcriptional regulator
VEPLSLPAGQARPRRFRRSSDIVRRIEQVRAYTGLTKRRFCEAIGIEPQTYGKFAGGQRSKPNLELIHGVVTHFRVDPAWVLSGWGHMFLGGSDGQGWTPADFQGWDAWPAAARRAPSARERPQVAEILGPVWQHIEGIIDRLDRRHRPLLERLMRVLHDHARANPAIAAGELQALLDYMESRPPRR